MRSKNICPMCESGTLTRKEITETFNYHDHEILVPNYIIHQCDFCEEAIVDPASLKESGKILRAEAKKIDGLLTGKEIKQIRNSLGLTQEGLSKIIGGGDKCIAKYESEALTQSKPMDNLLRIIRSYPDSIHVLTKLPIVTSENKTSMSFQVSENYNPRAANHENIYKAI